MHGGGVMRLNPGRVWRALGVGFFLMLIGVGGTLMAVTVFPLLTLVSRDPVTRQRRVLYAIHLAFRLYCGGIRWMGVASIETVGTERLRALRGALIVANHPSLLDVVMIMAATPSVQCIVKAGLWRHPFFRLTVGGARFIRNDLEPEALLAACAEALREGRNLIVFPEGTRTLPGVRPKLQRGFANMAIAVACPVQVVTITCDPPILHKGHSWWRAPEKRSCFRLEVGELLDVGQFTHGRARPLAARRMVAYLENFYAEKLGYGHAGTRIEETDRRCPETGRCVA
ncbi:lysophospholipid acyltransferase family protein [Magnetospirillum sulfuroxidans]|uniref:1-acyl-sn-glycerol-3-phosphate acyltransferase n=1 Tax=Magnetospirillum sulfuroxidans TaxID=611300 RepID=A0ABS5I6X3_9PROT|nr:lysophospholipid acyltransferase family protein [Magnetospirillum sulfuroxidans]MBR9970175.1 1-acyl-sn-glycerol-3-phosphate acyltransferase [Magnetospirillum sulfuroxidans]